MADYFMEMSGDGRTRPVVSEEKTLGDGTKTTAKYDATAWTAMKADVLMSLVGELMGKGFDPFAYADERQKKIDDDFREACAAYDAKVADGWAGMKNPREQESYFGYCAACGQPPGGMFDILTCSYLACWKCRRCHIWESGYVSGDDDETQARHMACVNAFDELVLKAKPTNDTLPSDGL